MATRSLLTDVVLFVLVATTGTLADSGIKGPPQVTSQGDLSTSQPIGASFRLDCPIEGHPRPLLEWFKDGEAINTAWPRFRATTRGLRIRDAELEDSGVYVCKGVNGFGSEEVSLRLAIYDPNAPATERSGRLPAGTLGVRPFFTGAPQESKIRRPVGATLSLRCHVDGVPEPQLVWYKDRYALPELHHGKDAKDRAVLHFNHLALEDSGTYLCRASNPFGSVENSFEVQVVERAERRPEVLRVQCEGGAEVLRGEEAVLECRVSSEVQPHIQWLKLLEAGQGQGQGGSDVLVVDGRAFQLLRQGAGPTEALPDGSFSKRLTIPRAALHDSGNYVCLATNEQGYHHAQTAIKVLAAPHSDSLPMSVLVSLPAAGVVGAVVLVLAIYYWRRRRHKARHRRRHQDPHQQQQQQQQQNMLVAKAPPGMSIVNCPHLPPPPPSSSTSSSHLVPPPPMTSTVAGGGGQAVMPARGLRRDCWQQCQQPLLHHVSSSDQSRNSLQGVGSADGPVADSNREATRQT